MQQQQRRPPLALRADDRVDVHAFAVKQLAPEAREEGHGRDPIAGAPAAAMTWRNAVFTTLP
jgi:hypothetical protein